MFRRLSRFNKKNSYTREKSLPFITFNPHTNKDLSPSYDKNEDEDFLVIAAIDPAIKNCAVRIERNCKTILQTKFNFIADENVKYYEKLNEKFEEILPLLSKCHYILVESQLPINTEMVRISQAIISFLMVSLKDKGPNFPLIIEIDPKLKSSILGAGPMKKPELKKWASLKGMEILELNGDLETLEKVKKERKKDDHGDVICYTTAWRKMLEMEEYKNVIKLPIKPI